MKNKERLFLIIADIFIFILVVYPIFQGGIVGGFDPGFHMARINTLASNIASGHFPNPIGFEYLDKFGYGVGFFYGNFFLYPFAILNALGVSAYNSYVIYLLTFVILNIFSINFVINKMFHNTWATILSAPIYLSSYYIYGVIYTRAAAGELIAFALIPWVLLSAFKMIQGQKQYWIMLAVSLSMLFVTHILSFLITVGAVLLIFVMNLVPIFQDKKLFLSFVKSGLLFLGLSSVFLFSFVQQYLAQKFVNTSMSAAGGYSVLATAFLMPNHVFDTQQFVAINGTFLVILLLGSLVYYLYKARGLHLPKVILQSYIIILIYTSFLVSPDLLKIYVKLFKPLVLLQVMSRVDVVILPLLTLVVANALGQIISNWGKFKMPVAVVFMAVIGVITVMFPIKSNMDFVATRKGPIAELSVSMGEYEPNDYMTYNVQHNSKLDTAFLEKSQNYQVITNNHQKAVIQINDNKSARTIMLPRIYYKGYQVTTSYNGKNITTPALVKNGLVSVKLPADLKSGKVTVAYKLTSLAKAGWFITIVSLIILGWLLFKKHPDNDSAIGEVKQVA